MSGRSTAGSASSPRLSAASMLRTAKIDPVDHGLLALERAALRPRVSTSAEGPCARSTPIFFSGTPTDFRATIWTRAWRSDSE